MWFMMQTATGNFIAMIKVEESDAVVLSVSQILELDPTLRVIELHEGQEAVRDLVNHKWVAE